MILLCRQHYLIISAALARNLPQKNDFMFAVCIGKVQARLQVNDKIVSLHHCNFNLLIKINILILCPQYRIANIQGQHFISIIPYVIFNICN